MIPVYNEQAERYQNTESGKFMGTAEAESILEALNNQTVLLNEIDENTEETPEEKRQKSLNEENTQKVNPFAGMGGKIGEGLKSVGGFLKDKNPLSTDRNPITRLLGFGALAGLLKLFGDKLTGEDGYLTQILEWFKLTFIPWTVETWNAIKDFDWSAQFKKVTDFFDKIKNFFVAMDTNDDGTVDFDELKTGITTAVADVAKKLAKELEDGFWTLIDKYKVELGLVFAGYVVSKAVMSSLIYGTAGSAALGKLGLAAVIVAGAALLIDKVKNAYNAAIEDETGNEQEFDFSEFVAYMLAGPDNKEGLKVGWLQAFTLSWKDALAGAAVGAGLGAIGGAGLFSLPAMLIGAFAGGMLGAMGKKIGSDDIDAEVDKAGEVFVQLKNDLIILAKQVKNQAQGLVDAVAAALDPSVAPGDAFDVATLGDGKQNEDNAERKIRNNEQKIKNLLIDIELNKKFASSPAHEKILNASNYHFLEIYRDEIKQFELEKQNAYKTADRVNNSAAANTLKSLNTRIDAKKQSIADLLNSGAEPNSEFMTGQYYDLNDLEQRRGSLLTENPMLALSDMGSQIKLADLLEQTPYDPQPAAEYALKQKILASQRLEDLNKNFTQPPGQIINAPTSIKNEGDTHISTLKSTPSYSTSNILSATWTLAYGYPDMHR
jgi:hypothetical protein